MKVDRTALACYPGWWRGRYQEEVALVLDALVAEGRSPSRLALSVFRGVLDARLHGTGMPMERAAWAGRARGAMTLATLPWMLVTVLVLVVWQGQGEFPTSGVYASSQLPLIPELSPAGVTAVVGAHVLLYAWAASLLVVLYGWGPVTGAIYMRANRGGPRRRRLLNLLPISPFLLLLVASVIVAVQQAATGGANDSAIWIMLGGWLAVGVWAAVEVPKLDLSPNAMHRGRWVSVALSALFGVMTVAVATWGASLALQPADYQVMRGPYLTVSSPLASWWAAITAVFAIVTLGSALGARTAVKSWRVARAL